MNDTAEIPGTQDDFSPLKILFIVLIIAALALFPFVIKNRFYISLLNEMLNVLHRHAPEKDLPVRL